MDERYLPGGPTKKLVKQVKRALSHFGIRPVKSALWFQTWDWANKIALSYVYRKTWPSPSEIASQYVFLLLMEMYQARALKMPYRAADQMPEAIRAKVAEGTPVLALPAPRAALPQPREGAREP